MHKILIALALVLSAAVAVPAVAHQDKGKSKGKRPDVIALPNGFQPEGIATSKRDTFFVGSRDNGAIYRGSLRTGEGAILVPGASPTTITSASSGPSPGTRLSAASQIAKPHPPWVRMCSWRSRKRT